MEPQFNVFGTPREAARGVARRIAEKALVAKAEGAPFHLAISGGKTPEILFELLAFDFQDAIPWANVHISWVDERCVPETSIESNVGNARRLWLSKINIPESNIHPIQGGLKPEYEVTRYGCDLAALLPRSGKYPVFDLILLGMGDDGHTASIFPNQTDLLFSENVCDIAEHPVSGQKRITLSGITINKAKEIAFFVTGRKKAHLIKQICDRVPEALEYPAARIEPENGRLSWFIDQEAAHLLT